MMLITLMNVLSILFSMVIESESNKKEDSYIEEHKMASYYFDSYYEKFDSVLINTKYWLHDDSCAYGIIDITQKNILKSNNTKYIMLLNEFCCNADGCVGEYLDVICNNCIRKRTHFIIQTIRESEKELKGLELFLIFWVINEFEIEDSNSSHQNYNKYIGKLLKEKKVCKEDLLYLNSLYDRAVKYKEDNNRSNY